MKITNDTTVDQVAELMGDQSDQRDGYIMMSLLSRDCVVDTDECDWDALMAESQKIRHNEDN
jgi:hypothetical protein